MVRWTAGILALALTLVLPSADGSVARAQSERDDVQWEVRRAPYRGGPVRPGAQLHSVANSELTALGGTSFMVGFLTATIVGLAASRPIGIVPLVGPWLAAFDVPSDQGWHDTLSPTMIAIGIAQALGMGLIVAGILTPSYELVFDAPRGGPSPFEARLRLAPYAPGAELGVSLTVEAL